MTRINPIWTGLAGSLIAMSQVASVEVSGIADVRVGAADGETSWQDGGFGKLRLGGDDGDWSTDAELARAALVLRPRFSWTTSAYIHIEVDPDQDDLIGISEAFLLYKAPPSPNASYSLRAGVFYPPVSLEHDGPAWSTTRTLTPSAINSWIGEEVKLAGLEGTARFNAGNGEVGLTGGLFGYNDTSATLLTFRGWALHDHQITTNGTFPLPNFNEDFWAARTGQDREAQPFTELDGRPGYYVRFDWRPDAPFAVNVLHYDNAGDTASTDGGQTSWATTFTNVGLRARIGENTEFLAQALVGESAWRPAPQAAVTYTDDISFSSAYALLDHQFNGFGLAARVDLFETTDKQTTSLVTDPEEGWSATLALRKRLDSGVTLMLEGVVVDSSRATRRFEAIDHDQTQSSVQAALRWEF